MDVEIEDGNRIFSTGLHQPPEEIRAASTISQRLAEAFKQNRDSPDTKKDTPVSAEDIPAHLRNSVPCSPKNPLMSCQTPSLGIMP